MIHDFKPSVLALLSFTLLVACDGCSSRVSTAGLDAPRQDAGVTRDEESEFITEDEYEMLPIGQHIYLSDGYKDSGNQYPFVVMIDAIVGAHEIFTCSGVLLNPRLVLTAGHCVCEEHEVRSPEGKAHAIIDGSRCARNARIETVTYAPKHDGSEILTEEQLRSYEGKVRPHPGLEILLNERLAPISSKADLAVIALDEPVDSALPAIDLPASDPSLNEAFMISGYGFDGRSDLIVGIRRFGRKKVKRLATLGGDRIVFEQDGAAFNNGSGEPCLRQKDKRILLMGITTMISEEGAACTSTYLHRDWLLSEIRRTAALRPNRPGVKESAP